MFFYIVILDEDAGMIRNDWMKHPKNADFKHEEWWCMDQLTMVNTYGDGSKPWYLVNPKIAGIYGCSSH